MLNDKDLKMLLESTKAPMLSEADKSVMTILLNNTSAEIDRLMNESTVAGDISQFTPIMMPLVRRVYPTLIANELLGIQPMVMPTGFIYSLVNRYTGNGKPAEQTDTAKAGQILEFANVADVPTKGTAITGATSGATGSVIYTEGKRALVKVNGVMFQVEALTGGSTSNVTAVYTNEATFKKILKNYTGSVTTAVGEKLATDMAEVGFGIEKKAVEVKTRKLKGRYTLEMYEDLKAQHGLLADEELMSLMSAELQSEIDREVVDFVNSNAVVTPNAFAPHSADGRWEIEKYRAEVIKIANEARQIGIDTKRGQANIILCSPKVVTMLEQVGSFRTAQQDSAVVQPLSGGVAGIFDGKYKVVCDQYATNDYATLLYKGADRRDSLGFFAPYTPLSFIRVTDVESGQPALILRTRYALDTTPLNPEAYARTFGVDFANTALAK